MNDNIKRASKTPSLMIAPTNLAEGPLTTYPQVYMILPTIKANPNEAEATGKYIPAPIKNTTEGPNIYTKFI